MTKQELIGNYTMEQLAEMVIELQEMVGRYGDENYLLQSKVNNLIDGTREIMYLVDERNGNIKEYNILGQIGEGTYFANGTGVKINDLIEFLKYKNDNEEKYKVFTENKELKSQLDRKQTEINQIDEILNELFGVTHDAVKTPDEFRKILKEETGGGKKEFEQLERYYAEALAKIIKSKDEIEKLKNRTIYDFLPAEPIKIADALIDGWKADAGREQSTALGLRQVAEHLLAYCKAKMGDEKQ